MESTHSLEKVAAKNNKNKEDEKTFKQLLHGFMSYTTAHGIGRLADAKTVFWKIFWTAVCLAAFGMFLSQTIGLFKLYLSKPVSTAVKITFEKKLPFPAVTICNLNMLRKDSIPETVKALLKNEISDYELIERHRPEDTSSNTTTTPSPTSTGGPSASEGPVRRRRRREVETDEDSWDDEDEDEDLLDEYPSSEDLEPEDRIRIQIAQLLGDEHGGLLGSRGHQFDDLIDSCSWKGQNCKHGNLSAYWTWLWNYKYGNCFTFNSGADDNLRKLKVLKASKPGPSHGLTLHLNLEQEQYIGPLTIEAGVRVLIHEQGKVPFPYDEGFSVSPGMATSIGLRKTKIFRLDRFQNNSCWSDKHLPSTNIYKKHQNISLYSQQACLQSCLGASQLEMCQCSEVAYPSDDPPCDVLLQKTANCLIDVKRLFNNDKLTCLGTCTKPCQENVYEKTISASQWPSISYKNYLKAKGKEMNESDNRLLLNIFYNELNYQSIEEEYSYGDINLIADIGGQLGLWIGISVLTCCELLELLIIVLQHLVKKCKTNQKERGKVDNTTA